MRLDCVSSAFAFVIFFWHAFQPFKIQYALFNGSYSRDPQVLYSEKKIKNESHDTIHTSKNYFVTIFSIFS